jgi:Restriction alleviation protein Lar
MTTRQLVLPKPKIKPCPFCHSNDLKVTPVGTRYLLGYRMVCLECGSMGPQADGRNLGGNSDKAPDLALDLWNQR